LTASLRSAPRDELVWILGGLDDEGVVFKQVIILPGLILIVITLRKVKVVVVGCIVPVPIAIPRVLGYLSYAFLLNQSTET
jgi:hypothetical protein